MSRDGVESKTAFLYELARDRDTTALVGYLKRGEKPLIRRRAAELLGDFDDVPQEQRQAEIRQALIEAVETETDDSVRARAIDSLSRHGNESLEALVDHLSSDGVSDGSDWVTADKLCEWLDAEYSEFRMVAATALGEFGTERALPALTEAVDDPDPRVREPAIRSCGMLGDDRCVSTVQTGLTDPNTRVQEAAAMALGNIGTERALEALVPATRSETESVRRIAVEELGQFGSLEPLVVLLEALEDDADGVAEAAMLSLLRLLAGTPSDRTTTARETIADQLRTREDEFVVGPLVEIYHNTPRQTIRRTAVWFLGRVTADAPEPVLGCLLDALDSSSDAVVDAATDSLESLGERDDEVVKRLRIFRQREAGSERALARVEALIETLAPNPAGEVVTNSVDVTYVREPADYSSSRPSDDDSPE